MEALSSRFQSHLAPVYLGADGQGAYALEIMHISRHGLASALRQLCSVVFRIMPAGWQRRDVATVVFARVAVYGDVAAADLLLNDGGIFSCS